LKSEGSEGLGSEGLKGHNTVALESLVTGVEQYSILLDKMGGGAMLIHKIKKNFFFFFY
jgi:hypothetical protein